VNSRVRILAALARVSAGALLTLGPAMSVARAADSPPDPDLATQGMRRLGPFHVRPLLILKDAGYDDNIRVEAQEREGDTTATAGAGIEAVLLTGNRGGIRLAQEFDYVAFARNTDLNHWNGSGRARGVLVLKGLAVSLEDRFTSVRERPTTEIDQRVRRENNALTAALRTLRKGRLGFRSYLRHERIDHGSDDAGSDLVARRLDRDENALSVSGELRVLPKTTFVLEGLAERIEFENEAEARDTRARSVLAGFRFDPSASLQGEFRLGTIRIEARDRPQSDYRGPVGDGRLSTRLGRRARLKATYARDLGFSILAENLYYVQTDWTVAFEHFFSRRLSGEILYGRGLNHYPEEVTRDDAVPFKGIRDDRLNTHRGTVRFWGREGLGFLISAQRVVRDSTDDFFDRSRNFYTFGTTYAF
jgi:hypothetical protein